LPRDTGVEVVATTDSGHARSFPPSAAANARIDAMFRPVINEAIVAALGTVLIEA
jgi:hypothetical protein